MATRSVRALVASDHAVRSFSDAYRNPKSDKFSMTKVWTIDYISADDSNSSCNVTDC